MLESDLIVELMELNERLTDEVESLEAYGCTLAEKEHAYKTLEAQKALLERNNGTSVSFIATFIKGDPEVAKTRLERDIAEVRYKACQEKINAIKTQIRVVDSQASREWSTRDVCNTPTPPWAE